MRKARAQTTATSRFDPTAFKNLTLRVRYDDGFIAYLNGNEIVRVSFDPNATPQWDSAANGTRPDEQQAVQLESFDGTWSDLAEATFDMGYEVAP